MAYTLKMVDGRGVLIDEDGKERVAAGESPALSQEAKPATSKAPTKKAASSKSDK